MDCPARPRSPSTPIATHVVTAGILLATLLTAPVAAVASEVEGGASTTASGSAQAKPTEPDAEKPSILPDGYGGTRFGMSKAQVSAIIPDLQLVSDTEKQWKSSPETSSLPPITVLGARDREVLGMTGCSVEFRFVADQLYFIAFDCGKDLLVRKKLERAYGEVSEEVGGAVYWYEGPRTVSLNLNAMRFAFIDSKMDRVVQQTMAAALIKQMAREQAEAAPEPNSSSQPDSD